MNNKLITMYQSGMTCQSISDETGIPMTSVWYRLKKLGVEMKPTGTRMKGKPNHSSRKFDWNEAKELYLKGLNATEISKKLGVSISAIIRSLKAQQVLIRPSWQCVSMKAVGNVTLSSHGYKRISAGAKSRKYEHIVIAEKVLGRKLNKGEVVHHINCDKTDNRLENLLVCTHRYHLQLHARMRRHPYWKNFKGN
jgi:hypothetical protein